MGKNNQLSQEVMIHAARSCDSSYDGKFWLAVKTTKIYCLPTYLHTLPGRVCDDE